MPVRKRSCALVVTLALVAALVQVPPNAVAAGGPSVPLPSVGSVPVSGQGDAGPPADDQTGPGLSGDQGPRPIDPGSGDYAATAMKPSATWDVSAHTGDFSWSYPLRVPPAPGGLTPDIALSYSSSAVDGLTSSTNNQASWVGDGWSLWPGSVERDYRSCSDDLGGEDGQPGDLCWRSDNATLSLNGGATPLIRDDATGVWRPKNDDGSRVERITTGGNGDDNGESWRITTVDGTQYHFGTVPSAASTWTVPVYGDDAGEPCHVPGSFASSGCVQAYRWNLDKIVDRNGNMVLFTYQKEGNHYGRDKNSVAAAYDRGGWLHQVRYGLRADDASVRATGVVDFTTVDRCVRDSDCTWSKPDNLPDVPLDLKCDGGSCPNLWSPTFWTTKRLRTITTRVLRDGSYQPVDSWTLRHELPDPGDGEKPALWLAGITHAGHADGTLSLPEVTFHGARLVNRVHGGDDGYASLVRFRMNTIVSETGGAVSIRYAEPECVAGRTMPAEPHTNTLRCFPSKWKPTGAPERTDHFHKYVVAQVSQVDGLAGGLAHETHYEYLGGAAWHWPTADSGEEDRKTWNEFRGFATVRVRTGSGQDGNRTMAEQRFHRGMHGDKLPGGATRAAEVKDSENKVRADVDWLRGFEFENASFRHEQASPSEPPRLTKTITDPHVTGPTATRGPFRAHRVLPGVTTTYTLLTSGRRTTRMSTAYDDHGRATKVDDEGDVDDPEDDRCTLTGYREDTTRWLVDLPSRTETFAVRCDRTPVFPRDAITDRKITYDADGNPTRIEVAKERPATGPVYVTTSTTAYDSHGRVTASTDALGNTTTTAYTPAIGGPTTTTAVTAPRAGPTAAGLVTTTTHDPSSGQAAKVEDPNGRVTETDYDALGRRTEIWLPNRPRATHARGNARFAYEVRTTGPVAVTTTRIGPNGVFTAATELYDGLLRLRQKQTPAAGGGRLLADTRYDSHGRPFKVTRPYYNEGQVGTDLVFPADAAVPAMTVTEFDDAGRPVAEVLKGTGFEWRTTTEYGGDRVHVTPRQGGTPTTTITDAHGRTVELRQHHGSGYHSTTYRYTKAGRIAQVVDEAGNTWRAEYDLRGRMTTLDDPDQGVTAMTYDDADRLTTTTDGRGGTVAFSYDGLGRRTGSYRGQVGGTRLAEWTYDTASNGKGHPATTTRFAGGHRYTTSIGNYSQLYRPTEKSVTIPATDPALAPLAGTYTWFASYGWDGSLSGESYPEVGGLETETVDYVLDDAGRPRSSTGTYQGDTVDLVGATAYTRYGEVERLQLGSGTKRAWISRYYEDSTRRLKRTIVDAEVPAPMQTDINHTYDPQGNITSITDRPIGLAADTQCFRYDGLRRLTAAWTPAASCADPAAALGGPAQYRNGYTYDPAGNRLTATRNGTTSTYTYPSGHTVSSVTTTSPSGTNTVDYTYDEAGNTTTRTGERFDWDEEGTLTSVTKGGATTSFVHTADGERLLKTDPGGTTLYLLNQEVRLAKGSSTPKATRYYTFHDETVAVRQGAALTWLAGDHQGTPQVAVNSQTLQVTKRRFDPFGVPRGTAPTAWPGEKSFVGGEHDPSTGLTHLGARDYDPELGRFLSLDPVMDLSDPQQLHGYAYANNTPVTSQDASGLFTSECDNCGYVDSRALQNKEDNPKSKPYKPRGKPNGTGRILPSETVFSTPKKINDVLGAVLEGLKRSDLIEEHILALGKFGDYNEFIQLNRWYGKVLDVLDHKWVRSLGRLSALLGPGLSYADYRATGDRPVAAAIKTGIETGFSWGGALIGGGVGGLLGAPFGMLGSPTGMVAGAGGGAYLGNMLGGEVAKAADPVIDIFGAYIEDGIEPHNLVGSRLFDIGIGMQAAADGSIREKARDGEISGSDIVDSSIDVGLSVLGW
ncbi:type IV secretion protein Rhs [Saccharothrix sp. S26]|uniref:RHS repeat-associated core domain-containing protein n=1 Tax=Saccharothrix sp. S26 TaxID=2907215 RepID=UPI001F2F7033|nr:RHS repeat-associated core domain-containing protein [Saccharothrix sp. S26]MCE6995374.1 type IV secretion protein Rhs [Saccharothrix sp. S26]